MMRIWAIARLTFAEGVRMRIVLVFVLVLALLVLNMPFWLRGDETVSGRLQNFLDYALNAASICLALATVFLSCGTLAGEIRSHVIQTVIAKPVHRFEILCGKWLGVMLLNLLLLALCGGAIYLFASYLRGLPTQNDRDRRKLDDTVWIARYGAKPIEPDFRALATQEVEQRIAEGGLPPEGKAAAIRDKVSELRSQFLVIPPRTLKTYDFEGVPSRLGGSTTTTQPVDAPPGDTLRVLQVVFRARGIPLPQDEILPIWWMVNDPETGAPLRPVPVVTEQRSGDTHSFLLGEGAVRNGKVSLTVSGPFSDDQTRIAFEGRDPLRIYYPVGIFEVNYLKALLIILLRLSFLAALGLIFSTFVSFPVGCFCVFTWLVICIAKPWWLASMGGDMEIWDEKVDPYGKWGPLVRMVLEPLLTFAFPDFTYYDGVSKLIDGIYIPVALIGWASLHTLLFGLALLLILGWFVFERREIAEVQL